MGKKEPKLACPVCMSWSEGIRHEFTIEIDQEGNQKGICHNPICLAEFTIENDNIDMFIDTYEEKNHE